MLVKYHKIPIIGPENMCLITNTYLKMKGLVVDGDSEGVHILIVDANDGAFESHAAASDAFHHFLLGLDKINNRRIGNR